MKLGDSYGADVIRGGQAGGDLKLSGRYEVECFGQDGKLKWKDEIQNLVTNAGEDHALDSTLAGGTQITSWFVGLTDSAPTTAEGDTMSSHAGWTEVTAYSEAARQAFTAGTVSGQSVDNSASKAAFSINGTATVGGAFLVSNSTKSGTTGTLYSVGAFTGGDKPVSDGDTLNVTLTFTAAGS